MPYYDDRDYYNADNIDDLYDDEMIFEEEDDNDDVFTAWEYGYHNLTNELVDD